MAEEIEDKKSKGFNNNFVNSFEKGMNKMSHPSELQMGHYLDAWNAINYDSKSGNIFHLLNEKGFKIFSDFNEKNPNSLILGGYFINNSFIICSIECDPNDKEYKTKASEIGVIDNVLGNWIYTTVIKDTDPKYWIDPPTNSEIEAYENSNFLNFNIKYPIRCQARISFDNKRVLYFVDGLNLDRQITIDTDYSKNKLLNLSQELSLVDYPDKTTVKYVKQQAGGTLKPGVYQFVTRYLNDTLDKTNFGYICNPIPVVDETFNNRNDYDGANYDAPDINKSIVLEVSDLDLDYKYFELAVIYYEGTSSQIKVAVVQRYEILDTKREVIFDGTIQEDLVLDEILLEPTYYSSSKHIIQKDGRLFRSNLKSNPNLDMQPIANLITVKLKVKQIEYNENDPSYFEDYKNENMTFENKSYMGDEIYDFGLVGVSITNEETFVAHIPAKYSNSPTEIDVFESGINYPLDSNFKDVSGNDLSGTPIRYHKFPSRKEIPHYIYYHNDASKSTYFGYTGDPSDPRNGKTYIQVFGIEIDGLEQALAKNPKLASSLKKIKIVRQKRDSLSKRSILTQGFAHDILVQDGVTNNKDFGEIVINIGTSVLICGTTPIYSSSFNSGIISVTGGLNENIRIVPPSFSPKKLFSINPLFENTTIQIDNDDACTFFTYGNFQNTSPELRDSKNFTSFISPEIVFNNINIPGNTYIDSILDVEGESVIVNGNISTPSNGKYDYPNTYIAPRAFAFCNFNKHLKSSVASKKNVVNSSYISTTNFIPAYDLSGLENVDIITPASKWDGLQSEKYCILKLNEDVSNFYNNSSVHTLNVDNGLSISYASAGLIFPFLVGVFALVPANEVCPGEANNYTERTSFTASSQTQLRTIRNIKFNNPFQYGQIDAKEYVEIGSIDLINYNSNNLSFYNGDVFISKFYYIMTHDIDTRLLYQTGETLILTVTLAGANLSNIGFGYEQSRDPINLTKFGMPIRGANWVFLESEINCNYRHRPVDYTKTPPAQGVPYYPKTNINECFSVDPELGHSNGYNIQYSFENNLIKYYSTPVGFQGVYYYPTRTIFSEQTLEGEQSDKYRTLLPNSYQDLPKDKGEITGHFILNDVLYIHTERSLFKTYVNQNNMVQGSNEDIIMGSAKIFGYPPDEVFDIDGGYLGCIHKDSSISTPFGQMFVDYYQRKVFFISESPEEISQINMTNWFNENISIQPNRKYQDPNSLDFNENYLNNAINPNAAGILATYDAEHKRVLITIKDFYKDDNECCEKYIENHKTISFSFLNKAWVSMHEYYPDLYLNGDLINLAISNKNKQLMQMNKGDYGKYFGSETYKFLIKFSVNPYIVLNKVFDNQTIAVQFSNSKSVQLNNFFNKLICTTTVQSSGEVDLILRNKALLEENEFLQNVYFNEGRYQIKVPLSKTVNYLDEDVFNQDNLNDFLDEQPRLRDYYMVTKYIYDNENNLKLDLANVLTKFRVSHV